MTNLRFNVGDTVTTNELYIKRGGFNGLGNGRVVKVYTNDSYDVEFSIRPSSWEYTTTWINGDYLELVSAASQWTSATKILDNFVKEQSTNVEVVSENLDEVFATFFGQKIDQATVSETFADFIENVPPLTSEEVEELIDNNHAISSTDETVGIGDAESDDIEDDGLYLSAEVVKKIEEAIEKNYDYLFEPDSHEVLDGYMEAIQSTYNLDMYDITITPKKLTLVDKILICLR